MASPHAHTPHPKGGNLAERVSAEVSNALKGDKSFEDASVALSALIAGEMADALADLPVEQRLEINKRSAELVQRVRQTVEGFGQERHGTIALSVPSEIEVLKGEGLGATVSSLQGERTLNTIAVSRKLEDWAGPVAGATELSRQYGVARSSLHRWQQDDDVIGLLKGTKKHVYPVEQFLDGRPVRGLRNIIKHAGSHRVAWLWLIQRNPVLGGSRPVDLLKQDRVNEVTDAAASYFNAP